MTNQKANNANIPSRNRETVFSKIENHGSQREPNKPESVNECPNWDDTGTVRFKLKRYRRSER